MLASLGRGWSSAPRREPLLAEGQGSPVSFSLFVADPLTLALALSALFAGASVALFATRNGSPLGLGREAHGEVSNLGKPRWPYFQSALTLRLVIAVIIRFASASDFFAPDRMGYEAGGQALANDWAGGSVASAELVVQRYAAELNFYHYLNGVSFYVGAGPWLILFLNCVIGALVPGLLASITGRLGGSFAARRYAALLGAFFPSMVLWSAINIRDIWALTAILFALDSALAVRDRLSPVRFGVLAASMVLLGALRSYMFVLVALGIAVSVVASLSMSRVRGFIAALASALLCLYLYSTTGFGEQWVQDASLERVAEIRQGMTQGAQSAYLVEADISTPEGAMRFIPLGMAYFWLAPFPWAIRGLRQALTIPETLFLYWLIPHFVRGLRQSFGQHFSQAAMVACVIAVISMAYALVEGNSGTAYRHRAQVLGPVLAVAAIGLSVQRQRRAAQPSRGLEAISSR